MSSKGVFRKMETGLNIHNANFPMDNDGRTYHVGVKRGEVANRVVSVGDPSRAERLAELFDDPKKRFVLQTNRGFTTHTGLYKGVPVTVVATGMGVAMADFLVREVCAVTDGPMVFVRFGTCGSLVEDVGIGRVCVASQGSVMCHRYEDAWMDEDVQRKKEDHKHWSPCDSAPYYQLSRHVVPADDEISQLLVRHMQQRIGADKVSQGLNCTADTFYASQGRTSDDFYDHNDDWLQHLRHLYPHATTLEMETYQFFHLAQCSKKKSLASGNNRGRMRAAAACIVLANRVTNDFLGADEKHRLEVEGGRAILDAIVDVKLDATMDSKECVWNKKE